MARTCIIPNKENCRRGVADTVLADLKAPGRGAMVLLMDVRLSKVLLRYLTKVTKHDRHIWCFKMNERRFIEEDNWFMTGKGSLNHNSRKFHAKNTDPNRTRWNVEYCNEDIKDVYHELFDEALKRYNDKQTRKDRKIDDYYEKDTFRETRKIIS